METSKQNEHESKQSRSLENTVSKQFQPNIRMDIGADELMYEIPRISECHKNPKIKIEQFSIENPEVLFYAEDESSKLVNLSKFKIKDEIKNMKNLSHGINQGCNNISMTADGNKENEKFKSKNLILGFLWNFLSSLGLFNLNFLDIGLVIIFAIGVFLYILSLAGCNDTQTACLVNLNPQFFHNIVIFLTISATLNSLLLYMVIKKAIKKFHLLYQICIFSYLTFYYDTGSDLSNHGAYNRIVFLVLIIIVMIFINFVNFLINLIKQKYFKLICSILGFMLFVLVYSAIKISDCSKWHLGLNNKSIVNELKASKDKCPILSPQQCWIDFLDGLLDVSWYLQEDCQNFRTGERKELLKYIPQRYLNTYNFGYPITTKFSYIPESYHMPFFYNLMTNFIDLNDPKNNNVTNNYHGFRPEISLHFDKNTELGQIQINVQRNSTLVEERVKKALDHKKKSHNVGIKAQNSEINKEAIKEQAHEDLIENILFIYIDSISRQHFIRKMKNTIKFLEKYYQSNPLEGSNESNQFIYNDIKNNKTTFNFYQFLKYHAFIYFTQPNVNPMFYGESMMHNNGTHIIKYFHDRGFISAQANNICSRELYDIEPGYIENLNWEAFDYENIAMFCDPNYFNPENPFTPYMGPYSIKKRCLYGKNTFQYVLEFGEKFWEAYLGEKKFLRLAFQDAHEGTGEVARYLDEYLALFLENLANKNYLQKTAIFIVSDHGNNMIGFYNLFNCEDFIKEKTLATWFLLLPKQEFDIYDKNLTENENTMVTPYDIFDTLISLIDENYNIKSVDSAFKLPRSTYGQSVIKEIVHGEERSCKRYKLDMLDIWCRCDAI